MTAKKKGATGELLEKRRKVKGFWTIEVWFQSEIVYVCVQRKKGAGGRESREENKSEERGRERKKVEEGHFSR